MCFWGKQYNGRCSSNHHVHDIRIPTFVAEKALALVNLSYQWHFENSASPTTQSGLTETVVLMLLSTYVIFMPIPIANSPQLLLDSADFAWIPRSWVSLSAEAHRVHVTRKKDREWWIHCNPLYCSHGILWQTQALDCPTKHLHHRKYTTEQTWLCQNLVGMTLSPLLSDKVWCAQVEFEFTMQLS